MDTANDAFRVIFAGAHKDDLICLWLRRAKVTAARSAFALSNWLHLNASIVVKCDHACWCLLPNILFLRLALKIFACCCMLKWTLLGKLFSSSLLGSLDCVTFWLRLFQIFWRLRWCLINMLFLYCFGSMHKRKAIHLFAFLHFDDLRLSFQSLVVYLSYRRGFHHL